MRKRFLHFRSKGRTGTSITYRVECFPVISVPGVIPDVLSPDISATEGDFTVEIVIDLKVYVYLREDKITGQTLNIVIVEGKL